MRIALDAMGGDFAPQPNIEGAFEAVGQLDDLSILLVGDRAALEEGLSAAGCSSDRISIVESEGVVGMEEKPTVALRAKPNCSIVRCWQLMAGKEADAVVSAGNTGASVAAGCRRAAATAAPPFRSRRRAATPAARNGAPARRQRRSLPELWRDWPYRWRPLW